MPLYGPLWLGKDFSFSFIVPSSKSRDTKTRTDIKNPLHTKVRYCSVVSESVVICQLTLKMAEEIHFENRRISNFKGLVTLTLTSTYIPNFIGIGKIFCGWTDVRTYRRTYGRTSEPHIEIIRSTLRSRPNNNLHKLQITSMKASSCSNACQC